MLSYVKILIVRIVRLVLKKVGTVTGARTLIHAENGTGVDLLTVKEADTFINSVA